MDVGIYSVKANSQAGNTRVYGMTTEKPKNHKILNYGSRKLSHFAGKFSRGLWVSERALLGYVSVFQNTPKKLTLKSIFALKVEATLLSGSKKGAVGT